MSEVKSKPNRNELPTDRLATTDEKGGRVYLYPAEVKGRFRNLRSFVNGILLLVLLVLPWIQIKGQPAVLLDIPNRRFAILGLTFWAHEAPMLFFVIAGVVLALFLVTAIWGRVWCGWACPQTVFVDGVFRKIETWIEGTATVRRKLDQAPWSASKIFKKSIKWSAFTVAALIISHSFLAYFLGPEELGRMMRRSPTENWTAFLFMFSIFGVILFDFGWFREQFCTVVCPYGRFQSVLMDDSSQTVFYDVARGEPRRGQVPAGVPQGDCVNCYRCVQVCPTGVDIRRGVQMECIACTACIDACDDVMTHLKKPVGLIRYSSLKGLSSRAWIYGSILLIVMSAFAVVLAKRRAVDLEIVRAPEAPYQEIGNSRVINHFKLNLANQSFDDVRVDFALEHPSAEVKFVVSNHSEIVHGGQAERADLFIEYPKSLLHDGHTDMDVIMSVHTLKSGKAVELETREYEVRLVGPYR